MRRALVRVSNDVLAEALLLPKGIKVERVCLDIRTPDEIVIQVESADLPDACLVQNMSDHLMLLRPRYKTVEQFVLDMEPISNTPELKQQRVPKFDGWGDSPSEWWT